MIRIIVHLDLFWDPCFFFKLPNEHGIGEGQGPLVSAQIIVSSSAVTLNSSCRWEDTKIANISGFGIHSNFALLYYPLCRALYELPR